MFQSEVLNNLLNEINNENDDNICDICHEKNDIIFSKKLNCNHIFHYSCLKKTIKNCDKCCPYCKTSITNNDLLFNIPKCKAKLKSGKNKGKFCSRNAKINCNGYCKIHNK